MQTAWNALLAHTLTWSDCIPCAAGTYTNVTGSDEASDCILCLAGKFTHLTGSDGANDCVTCARGKYSEVPGADECLACTDCTDTPGSVETNPCTASHDTFCSAWQCTSEGLCAFDVRKGEQTLIWCPPSHDTVCAQQWQHTMLILNSISTWRAAVYIR